MAIPEGATKLGTVGIAYKGVYNELVTYKYANAVYYNGSTYIALIDNPAGLPSNDGVNWRYLAQGFLQQAISALTVIDESGILGEVDAEVNAQEFLSKIAELEQGLENTKANKVDILDTLEEIVANTQSGKVAGALAVKELNSNLSNSNAIINSITNGKGIISYASLSTLEHGVYRTNELTANNSPSGSDTDGILIVLPCIYSSQLCVQIFWGYNTKQVHMRICWYGSYQDWIKLSQ